MFDSIGREWALGHYHIDQTFLKNENIIFLVEAKVNSYVNIMWISDFSNTKCWWYSLFQS